MDNSPPLYSPENRVIYPYPQNPPKPPLPGHSQAIKVGQEGNIKQPITRKRIFCPFLVLTATEEC